MICPYCHQENKDNAKFCQHCGKQIGLYEDVAFDDKPENKPEKQVPQVSAQPAAASQQPNNTNNHKWIIAVVAIIAAAAVIIAAFLINAGKQPGKTKTATKNTTIERHQDTDDDKDDADDVEDADDDADEADDDDEADAWITPNGSTVYTAGPKATVEAYIRHWDSAISERDYNIVSPYIKPGSQMERTQSNFIADYDWYETLIEARITDSDEISHNVYQITTTETYDVTNDEYTDRRITQAMLYTVEKTADGDWEMTTIKKTAGNRMDRPD